MRRSFPSKQPWLISTAWRNNRQEGDLGVRSSSLLVVRFFLLLEALDNAMRYRISAYDARFISIAERLKVKLVMDDARLRRAVPSLTVSLSEAFT
jgi:predicted nucleic acid-binding protein